MTYINSGGSGGGNLQTATVAVITAVNTPLALQSLDNNNPKSIISTVKWGKAVLPAANTSGFTPGPVSFPLNINPGSWPVRLYNSGTPGTDAMLEAILPASWQGAPQLADINTYGTMFGIPYTAPAGLWQKNTYSNQLPIKTWAPLSPGAAPQQMVTGTFTAGTTNCQNIVWVSGTLGIWVFRDSSLNIRGIPFQVSPDGTTFQVAGTNTQIRAAGGNTLNNVSVTPCSATQVLVSWNDATNTKNEFAVVTISAGALPTAPTIAVGAITDDTAALVTAGTRVTSGALIQDFGGVNQWYVGATGATNSNRLRAYFLTVSGTTVAISATADYDSTHTINGTPYVYGYSPSANKLFIPGNWTGQAANSQVCLLTYNASNITTTWSVPDGFASNGGSSAQSACVIYPLDAAQGLYIFGNAFGSSDASSLVRLDITTGAFTEQVNLGSFVLTSRTTSNSNWSGFNMLPIGDGEFSYINTGISGGVGYIDLKTYWGSGSDGAAAGAAPATIAAEAYLGRTYKLDLTSGYFGNNSSQGVILGLGMHQGTRRSAFAFSTNQDTIVRLAFFEHPKR